MTLQVAEALPHVAVIVALPTETAVTTPLDETAAAALLLDQVTAPEAVATNVFVCPTFNESVLAFNVTESKEGSVTITAQVAVALPHVAVITALPALTACTTPFDTVATPSALLDQVTAPEADRKSVV